MSDEKMIVKISQEKRNHGIDLLRIFSMFYVIILHTLGLGGILANLEPGTPQYTILWFVEIWASCAVNIFVIISGYTGFTKEEKKNDWSKLIILSLQVIFYGAGIAILYKFVHPDRVSESTIQDMFFPLTNEVYWFFCAYTGLFIIKPFLNAAVRSLEKNVLNRLMVIVFFFFCCFSMVTNPFRLTEGYSFSWFVILYLIGAALKKSEIERKISIPKALLGIIFLSAGTLLWKIYGSDIHLMNLNFRRDSLISYVSPVTVSAAIFHVLLFTKLRFSRIINRLIAFFAPGAFAVYLINTHPCLWLNEFENRFSEWARLKPIPALIRVLGYAVLFVGASLLLNKIRQFLFAKLRLRPLIYQLLYGPDRMAALRMLTEPAFGTVFALIWLFLFWKCPFGYGNIDESLYLTVPYRVLQWGDGLLVHEWHEFQLSTIPMLPASLLYNLIVPGTERIILNFRLIYTALWGCSALFFYLRLKRLSKTGAAAASLAYLIYAPYGIMAFSYNSMGILFLLNGTVIGITAVHHRKIQYTISGIFLAGAILCCPYLLSLYILLSLATLFSAFRKKDTELKTVWMCITGGAFLVFFVFCAILLSRASIQELLRAIPIVLDDVEHPDRSFLSKTLQYLSSVWHASPVSPFVLSIFFLICLVSRKWKQTADRFFPALCLGTIIWLLTLTVRKTHINYLMLPICMTGMFCRLNSTDRMLHKIFRWIWLPGMIYTYCLNYSSNQGLYAITNAAAVPAFASILISVLYVRSRKQNNKMMWITLCSSLAFMFLFQICSELYLRYTNVFWENGMDDQTVTASAGPEKDIRMTEAHLEEYNRVLAELEPLRNDPEVKRVLFFKLDPVLYLSTEKGIGAFSSWLPGINDHSVSRLDLYYELNPEKIPDAIYIPRENISYLSHFEEMGYQTTETSDENCILRRR